MATAYRIVFVHQGLDSLAKEVEDALTRAAQDIASFSELLEFSCELSDEDIPQVVAYLASKKGSKDRRVLKVIGAALKQDLSILPIVQGDIAEDIRGQLPEDIAHLNAVRWRGHGTNVGTALLELLGLVESERKVFISYRQSQTSKLATQLHGELVQRRFDVFLDRFSVEPGADFQRRLEKDLGDKAFVLLLESSKLRKSRWVRHEIAYAHARRIQMLALTLPECKNKLVPTIDEAFRMRFCKRDFSSDGTLSVCALERALETIELAHARALRRRREQILGSVVAKLRDDGCKCSPAGDWCVVAAGPNGDSRLFWVTPRRPTPEDFYSLSQQHQRLTKSVGLMDLKASVVHESGHLAEDQQRLLDWLSGISVPELATVGTCSV